MRYAGFWKRVIAYSVDAVLLQVAGAIIVWLLIGSTAMTDELYAILQLAAQDAIAAQQRFYALLFSPEALAITFGLPAFYNTAFVASPWQATPGKRWYGLQVVTVNGGRVSLPGALLRHAACAVSWLPIGLGFLMPLLHKEKAALHDLIAGTRVTFKEQ